MMLQTMRRSIPLVVTVLVAMSLWLLAAPRPAHASTTFTVNIPGDTNDANTADNLCDVNLFGPGEQCTLRAAIQQSNATTGADAIYFGIPDSFGTGVKTIHVGATSPSNGVLPYIIDTVTIDGYSQPGSNVNTLKRGTNAKLMVQLDGSNISSNGACGLCIYAPDVVVKGLVISRFEHGVGIENDATNARIEGNFIGTDPSGTKALGPLTHYGYANGVVIGDRSGITNHIVGGHTPAARNLISGNNDGDGVNVSSDGNQVSGNLIGTQRDGKSPLGNIYSGVHIRGGSNNVVGGATPGYANTIAFSGSYGVRVEPYIGLASVGNSIISNSIFSNAVLGIELGGDGVATLNDAGDADTGENNLQNCPTLSSAKKTATGKTIVKGKLGSNPNQTFFIQFFSNPKGTNEGRNLLGSKTVATNGTGNVSFTFSTKKPIKPGQNITTTATNSATGDTSEFSAPSKVVKF